MNIYSSLTLTRYGNIIIGQIKYETKLETVLNVHVLIQIAKFVHFQLIDLDRLKKQHNGEQAEYIIAILLYIIQIKAVIYKITELQERPRLIPLYGKIEQFSDQYRHIENKGEIIICESLIKEAKEIYF